MSEFAHSLIQWQKIHGRHDLPWQNMRNPYAIWVSEIMLQQTQVAAVIAYYQRFMGRFPDIAALAAAEEEEVMQYWSGLGYYSRARNLHRAAQIMAEEFDGVFPTDFEAIKSLPGIGRSTAAAISSLAFDMPQPILDGNVKRVLARHFLVEGWPGQPAVEKELWQLAEGLVPDQDMVAYTQGMMDLGATLCTRSKPRCKVCPVQTTCRAYAENKVEQLPGSKPRKAIPERRVTMLLLLRQDEILLEKRPSKGIWGGLWSLPEVVDEQENLQQLAKQRFGLETELMGELPLLTHTFSHFRLHITPQPMRILNVEKEGIAPPYILLNREEAIGAALPAPIRTLLKNLV